MAAATEAVATDAGGIAPPEVKNEENGVPTPAATPGEVAEATNTGQAEEGDAAAAAAAAAVVVDVVDPAVAEAALALAKAEAEAKAAEDAAALAEKVWNSLLQMLGTEGGSVMAAAGGTGLGAGLPAGGLVHRGLVNTGNSCFRNSVLQALLACEPFVEVLFRAAPGLRESIPAQEALPTWSQLARFAAAFEPPKPGVAAPFGASGSGRGGGSGVGGSGGGAWAMAGGRHRGGGGGRHHRVAGAVEPVLPDEAMSRAFGAFRAANTGEQEDAQEFLAFFLDQLHEEIVEAKKKFPGVSFGNGGGGGGGGDGGGGSNDTEDAWLEVGKGGAKAVVNTPDPRKKDYNSSVVTGLFYGMFRSEVKKSGTANSSVTLEAFHCLQLDLDPPPTTLSQHNNSNDSASSGGGDSAWGAGRGGQDAANGGGAGSGGGAWGTSGGRGQQGGGSANGVGGAWNGGGRAGTMPTPGSGGATVLESALAALFGGETVAGVKGRRNVEVKASRTLTLEQAPKVLTLHLKQFSFHPELGPRKLARRVRYPPELEIPHRVMSPALQHEANKKGPLKYRLFTVVLHHGRSLHGGHYTALVRDDRGEWKHYDDQQVSPETEGHALNPMSGHPYLLLYTRM
ncbi:unnamed protein product [Pylaiella littoralis]